MDTNNGADQPPRAWVWSEYRGEQPGGGTGSAPDGSLARQTRPSMTPDGRERPPLIPEKSGAGTGSLLALLVLIVAGMTWWLSSSTPPAKQEAAPQEAATPEPAAPASTEAEPAAPAPAEAAPPAAEAAPPAETKAPPPAEERHGSKKKRRH